MNKYAILYFDDDDKILLKYDNHRKKYYKNYVLFGNITLLSNKPDYLEIKGNKYRDNRYDREIFDEIEVWVDDGDTIFEAEDDNIAKLIYEVGGYE